MAHAYATEAVSIPGSNGPSPYAEQGFRERRLRDRRKADISSMLYLLLAALIAFGAVLTNSMAEHATIYLNAEQITGTVRIKTENSVVVDRTQIGDGTQITIRSKK